MWPVRREATVGKLKQAAGGMIREEASMELSAQLKETIPEGDTPVGQGELYPEVLPQEKGEDEELHFSMLERTESCRKGRRSEGGK
jgi:hypothetical protein